MRTTQSTARGIPLAVFLLFLFLTAVSGATSGEGTVQIYQTLEPSQINVVGMGQTPETANLTVVVQGVGATDRFPVDCMIVIDTSATSELAAAKSFALDFINRLGVNDRVGVVSFAATARLDVGLTKTKAQAKTAIGDLVSGDKSALGLALQLARRELVQTARPDATLVLLLLSDGQNNVGAAPTVEGQVAGETGVQIISVGIGTLINRTLLEEFATSSRGLFFARPSESALGSIIDHASVRIAASDLEILKRIPKGLAFVSAAPAPSQIRAENDGTTTVQWRIAELRLGQEVRIEVRLQASAKGSLATDSGSIVTYKDFRGIDREIDLAPSYVAVVMPNRAPIAEFGLSPAAPTTGDTIEFQEASYDVDDEGAVVGWVWAFGDGTTSELQNPSHRYAESGTYAITLIVVDDRGLASKAVERQVVVGNALPVASFTLREVGSLASVDQPRVGVEVALDASASYDLDGRVVRYAWDFDSDGIIDVESDSSEVTYSFQTAGDRQVTLIVTDNEGAKGTVKRKVIALSSVSATRTIDTCLPDDRTVAGGMITVTLVLRANTVLNGLAVSETIPAGWTFQSVETDGATLRQNGSILEWLFLERIADAGVDAQREIKYTLTAPSVPPSEASQSVSIHGYVGSSAPRISLSIAGEDKLLVVKYLSIPVVISRWNTETSSIDLCMRELIAFDQIQYAVSLWLSGAAVPYTQDERIDLVTMQDLIAYWLTGSSVHDPLP